MSSSLARERRPTSLRPSARSWAGSDHRFVRDTASLLSVAAALAAGCGSSRPPLLTSESGNPVDGGIGTGRGLDDGGITLLEDASGPPSCDAGNTGDVCGCLDLPLLADPPNMFFLLDRSGSMTDENKWATIRTVIATVIHNIGPRGRFGAGVFPDPKSTDSCAPGIQVMPLEQGDAPAGTWGPTAAAFTFDTDLSASGGTPTAATITALQPALTAFPGKTFVILATDGGPNCDSAVTCDSSACIANIESDTDCTPGGANCCTGEEAINCLDSAATVSAITALAAAGVPTYVIGVPGSGPYGALLNQMALAGGTARPTNPYYFPVDTADAADFTSTLSTVAAKITATCELTLSQAPPDPTQVNVYLDGSVVPQDPTNGWTLSGATVTLQGTTCATVLSGSVLDLRIVAGCPTVLK